MCKENYADLIVLTDLIEAGKITPIIDRTYPLAETPEAIRYVEQGHARGEDRHLRLREGRHARSVIRTQAHQTSGTRRLCCRA